MSISELERCSDISVTNLGESKQTKLISKLKEQVLHCKVSAMTIDAIVVDSSSETTVHTAVSSSTVSSSSPTSSNNDAIESASMEEENGSRQSNNSSSDVMLGLLYEFTKIYKDKLERLESSSIKLDEQKYMQEKIVILETWLSDLGEQNAVLVATVGELEREAGSRVLLLQESLNKMAVTTRDNCVSLHDHQQKMAELFEEKVSAEGEVTRVRDQLRLTQDNLQHMRTENANLHTDIDTLLDVMTRARASGVWRCDDVMFLCITPEQVFGPVLPHSGATSPSLATSCVLPSSPPNSLPPPPSDCQLFRNSEAGSSLSILQGYCTVSSGGGEGTAEELCWSGGSGGVCSVAGGGGGGGSGGGTGGCGKEMRYLKEARDRASTLLVHRDRRIADLQCQVTSLHEQLELVRAEADTKARQMRQQGCAATARQNQQWQRVDSEGERTDSMHSSMTEADHNGLPSDAQLEAQLSANIDVLACRLSAAEADSEVSRADAMEASQRCAALERDLKDLQDTKHKCQNTIVTLQTQLEECEGRCDQLRGQLRRGEDDQKTRDQSNDQLRAQTNEQSRLQNADQQWAAQLHLARMENEISEKGILLRELQSHLSSARRECHLKDETLDKLESKLQCVRGELRGCEDRRLYLEGRLRALQEELCRAHQREEDLQQQVTSKGDLLHKLERENWSLAGQLNAKTAGADTLQLTADHVAGELISRDREVSEQRLTIGSLQDALVLSKQAGDALRVQLTEEFMESREEIDFLRQENAGMASQLELSDVLYQPRPPDVAGVAVGGLQERESSSQSSTATVVHRLKRGWPAAERGSRERLGVDLQQLPYNRTTHSSSRLPSANVSNIDSQEEFNEEYTKCWRSPNDLSSFGYRKNNNGVAGGHPGGWVPATGATPAACSASPVSKSSTASATQTDDKQSCLLDVQRTLAEVQHDRGGAHQQVLHLLRECNALEEQIQELMSDNSRLEQESASQATELSEARLQATYSATSLVQASEENSRLRRQALHYYQQMETLQQIINNVQNTGNESIAGVCERRVTPAFNATGVEYLPYRAMSGDTKNARHVYDDELKVILPSHSDRSCQAIGGAHETFRRASSSIDAITCDQGPNFLPQRLDEDEPSNTSLETVDIDGLTKTSTRIESQQHVEKTNINIDTEEIGTSTHDLITNFDPDNVNLCPRCAANNSKSSFVSVSECKTSNDTNLNDTRGDFGFNEQRIEVCQVFQPMSSSRVSAGRGRQEESDHITNCPQIEPRKDDGPSTQEAARWADQLAAITSECDRLLSEGKLLKEGNATLRQQLERAQRRESHLVTEMERSADQLSQTRKEREEVTSGVLTVVVGLRSWAAEVGRQMSHWAHSHDAPTRHVILLNTERRVLAERNAALQSTNAELRQVVSDLKSKKCSHEYEERKNSGEEGCHCSPNCQDISDQTLTSDGSQCSNKCFDGSESYSESSTVSQKKLSDISNTESHEDTFSDSNNSNHNNSITDSHTESHRGDVICRINTKEKTSEFKVHTYCPNKTDKAADETNNQHENCNEKYSDEESVSSQASSDNVNSCVYFENDNYDDATNDRNNNRSNHIKNLSSIQKESNPITRMENYSTSSTCTTTDESGDEVFDHNLVLSSVHAPSTIITDKPSKNRQKESSSSSDLYNASTGHRNGSAEANEKQRIFKQFAQRLETLTNLANSLLKSTRKIIRASQLESAPRLLCSTSLQDLRGINSPEPPQNTSISSKNKIPSPINRTFISNSLSNLSMNLPWEIELNGSLGDLHSLLANQKTSDPDKESLDVKNHTKSPHILCDNCRLNNMEEARNNVSSSIDKKTQPVSKTSQLETINELNNCDDGKEVKPQSSVIAKELQEIRDLIKSNASIVSTIRGLTEGSTKQIVQNQNTDCSKYRCFGNAIKFSNQMTKSYPDLSYIQANSLKVSSISKSNHSTECLDREEQYRNLYTFVQKEKDINEDRKNFEVCNIPLTTLI